MNSSSDYSKGYLAGFYIKNVNYPEFRGIDENYLPDFIKEQMDKVPKEAGSNQSSEPV